MDLSDVETFRARSAPKRIWLALAALVITTGGGTVAALMLTPSSESIGQICSTALIVLVFGLLVLGGASLFSRRAEEPPDSVLDAGLGGGAVASGAIAAVLLLAETWDFDSDALTNALSVSLAFATIPLAGGTVLRLLGNSPLASKTATKFSAAGSWGGAAAGLLIFLGGLTDAWAAAGIPAAIAAMVLAGALIAVPIMLARARSAAWSERATAGRDSLTGVRRALRTVLLSIATVWRFILRSFAAIVIGLTVLGIIAIAAPDLVIALVDGISAAIGTVPDGVWGACGRAAITACLVMLCGLGVLVGQRLMNATSRSTAVYDRLLGGITVITSAVAVLGWAGVIWDVWDWPDPFDSDGSNTLGRSLWGLAMVAILFLFAAATRLWSRRRARHTQTAGATGAIALAGAAVFLYVASITGHDPLDGEGVAARSIISLFVIAASALVVMPMIERAD